MKGLAFHSNDQSPLGKKNKSPTPRSSGRSSCPLPSMPLLSLWEVTPHSLSSVAPSVVGMTRA